MGPGSEYVIILNDPQLREGLVKMYERRSLSRQKPSGSVRPRLDVVHVLRGLASRIERSAHAWDATGPSQPATIE
jgi:hypothetical protein